MYAQFHLGSIFELSYSWGKSRWRCEGHSSPIFSVIFPRQEGQTQTCRYKLLYSGGVSVGTCRRGLVLGVHVGFSHCRTPGCMQVGASDYPASVTFP